MSDLLGPVPFEFLTAMPAAPLSRYVESIWYARGTVPYTREKIAPTGSTVAVVVLGDPIKQTPGGGGPTLTFERGFLLGPHDRPTVNEPTGETFAVGIVTTPVGCEAVFGLEPASIRGQAVDLPEAWQPADGLRDELLNTQEPDCMVALVEEMLTDQLDETVRGVERCQQAVQLLEADPTRPIADIAAELDITHGHLDREFTRVVGLSPRTLARLLRMRVLLSRIDVNQSVGWADQATELGWFDQAHLIRDFKRHTGVTPSQYVDAQRAGYTNVTPGDAAGFVPEP